MTNMANIFNVLDTISDSDRDQSINTARSKRLIEIKSNKGMERVKPKGLSLRSDSDMNVFHDVHHAKVQPLKVTQIDKNGCPISPGKETKKLVALSSKEYSCLKDETSSKITKAVLNTSCKTPSSKSIKKFSQPEKLAYWHDDQYELDYGYINKVEKEFKDLLLKGKGNKIKPYEEPEIEFTSDPETFISPKPLELDRICNEEYMKTALPSLDLPDMSDLSDTSDED